jgi:hypothetical protein
VESGASLNNWHCLSTEGAMLKPLHPAVSQHFFLHAADISSTPLAPLTTKKPPPAGERPPSLSTGPVPFVAVQYPDLGPLKASLHTVVVVVVPVKA